MGKRESSQTASLYRADIQGLRAVAVIAVVLFHVGGLLPGGYLGVDVFLLFQDLWSRREYSIGSARVGRLD